MTPNPTTEVDAAFVEDAVEFVDQQVRTGGAAGLMIVSAAHRRAIERLLVRRGGVDIQRRLVWADVDDVLGAIHPDGLPDELDFAFVMQPLVKQATKAAQGKVCVVSELLMRSRECDSEAVATELSRLWEAYLQRHASLQVMSTADVLAVPPAQNETIVLSAA